MTDRFSGAGDSMNAPAYHAFAVTPHASTALEEVTRALYVGGAGNVVAVLHSGAEVTFVGVGAGTVLPIRASHIRDTSTATSMLGLV